MRSRSAGISDRLRLGIKAAQAGHYEAAREEFRAVLDQDAANIPALLWLAFIAPSPHDSLRLLNQVLALDPDNERAQAGIRWAWRRLGTDPDQPGLATAPAPPPEGLRQQFLSDDVQKQAKKGALAQRARRNINPLLLLIMALAGVLGLMAIGLGTLVVVPPETLAAWWPPTITEPAVAPLAPGNGLPSLVNQDLPTPAGLALASPPAVQAIQEAPAWLTPEATLTLPEPAAFPAVLPETVATSSSLEVGPAIPLPTEPPALVNPVPLAHQPAYPGEKWIEVNLTTQQVTAWEGDVPVMSFVVSTGLPETPTVRGSFNIYWKLTSALMIGPNYYLPEVPYTMYFYRDYALHGTYWHSNFGQPMSHGCVNLSTDDSRKLFEWADPPIPTGQTQVVTTADNPGTLVVVHD